MQRALFFKETYGGGCVRDCFFVCFSSPILTFIMSLKAQLNKSGVLFFFASVLKITNFGGKRQMFIILMTRPVLILGLSN